MINVFWKKICDDKGVTPSWEYKECKEQIEDIERRISNSEQCINELKASQEQTRKNLGSKSFICIRTKNSIERHENNIEEFQKEKKKLTEKFNKMKLDFGE